MRILILGPTGPTGRLLVERALADGHDVTALARNPKRLSITHPRLAVVTGDATDSRSLESAMRSQDAALCALGAGNSLRSDVASRAVAALIPAMRAQG